MSTHGVDLLQDKAVPVLDNSSEILLAGLIIISQVQPESCGLFDRSESSQEITCLENKNSLKRPSTM